jgi:hypothetical protein
MKCASPPMVVVAVIIITGVVPQHSPGNSLGSALFLSLSAREFCIFRRFHISRRLLVPRARVLLIFARRVIHYSPGATRPEIYRRNKARTLKKKRLRSPVCSLAHRNLRSWNSTGTRAGEQREWDGGGRVKEFHPRHF